MLFGDAVVFFDAEFAKEFGSIRCQGMQLLPKESFVAAQFNAFLSHNLWLKNASHANEMARLLAQKLADVDEIDLAYLQQTNAVFAQLDRQYIEALNKEYEFSVWDEPTNEVRWMTSYATREEDVTTFVATIKKVLRA